MNSDSPLPQPSGVTCPHCGAALGAGTLRCSHCGAPIGTPASSALSAGTKTLLSCLLVLGALGFGTFGACLVFLGGGVNSDPTFLIFGALIGLAVIACIWGVFRVNKKS